MRISSWPFAVLAVSFAVSARADAVAAQGSSLSEAQQIAAAVLPLPTEFRETATVLGRRPGTAELVRLRQGSGPFICLANDPSANRFHVACYHRSLEPFMARGRELRAQGVAETQVDTVRFSEVESGRLKMPSQPASLYSLTGPANAYDAATGTAPGARALFVVYIPGATAESTGLSAKPAPGTPWIMYPGTPKAHIMFVPSMQ